MITVNDKRLHHTNQRSQSQKGRILVIEETNEYVMREHDFHRFFSVLLKIHKAIFSNSQRNYSLLITRSFIVTRHNRVCLQMKRRRESPSSCSENSKSKVVFNFFKHIFDTSSGFRGRFSAVNRTTSFPGFHTTLL